jgi:hypothetical protein
MNMGLPAELKPGYWSHVAGVVATFAIGFIWGGWMRRRSVGTAPAAGGPAIAMRPPAPKQK